MPKLIQVIVSEIGRGKGAGEDVYRIVTQYHDLDGNFLAENDPSTPSSMAREFVDTAAKIVQNLPPCHLPIDSDRIKEMKGMLDGSTHVVFTDGRPSEIWPRGYTPEEFR